MPWRPRSICAEPGCPELVPPPCPRHARTSSRNHYGVARQARGHGAEYERLRGALLGQPCYWCGKPADTADYLIPVSQGGTLDSLVASCSRCNYARGAAMTHRGLKHGVGGGSSLSSLPPDKDRMAAVFQVGRVQTFRADGGRE